MKTDFATLVRKDIEAKREKEKKAIPSKVFFNHFHAINYHLIANNDTSELKKSSYYNNLKIKNEKFSIEHCRKLLWNSWSTEYAFNVTSFDDNADFYRFALHWHFPQAYYSIYLAMTAFHETQGVANEQHEKSIKIFGNSVKDGHYPKSISFYANGLYHATEFNNLDLFEEYPVNFSSLSGIESCEDAQNQIACFLKSTRDQNAKNKRERGKSNYAKNMDFQNAKGELLTNFRKKQWNIIYSSMPETTILNLMYRLRIKANYHDIETFINADIDFQVFHRCLAKIIYRMNLIHEAYIHKVVGDKKYNWNYKSFKEYIDERK
jgi:hypothetical protein